MKKFIYLISFLFCINALTAQTVISTTELIPIDCNSGFATWSVTTDATTDFSYQVQTFSGGSWTDYGLQQTVIIPPNSFDVSNLFGGTFRVVLYDLSGIASDTSDVFMVNQPGPLFNIFTNLEHVSCFGGSDGTATVNPSGGTAPYTYSWTDASAIVVDTTQTATSLSPGIYICEITDVNGCLPITISVTITEPDELTAPTPTSNNVSCFGGNDGTATANASGGTAPYNYVWSDGQTTQTATFLLPGTYDCIITDANGCPPITISVTITEPDALTAPIPTSTSVSCFGGNDGTATANPSGGTAPYTYAWSDNQTTQTATGLTAGTYTCMITDVNGCAFLTPAVTITEPAALTAPTPTTTDVSCFGGSDGTATANPSGGTAPYIYAWSNGQTTQTTNGLSPGTYICTITDANGCTFLTPSVTISEPQSALTALTPSTTNVSCFGGSDGTATVNPTGGTTPYTYLWSNGQATQTANGLSAGPYTCDITDLNGCLFTTSVVTITEPDDLIAPTPTSTNVSCFGGSDGTATVNPTGGTTPYTYLWSTGDTIQSVTGLSVGTYSSTITDANGCPAINVFVTITEPQAALTASTPTTTDVSCFGGSDGTATVNPSGGTAPYTYVWSDNQTTQTATGLSVGTYTCAITDANGCPPIIVFVTITEPDNLITSTTSTNVSCFGGNDGTATVNPIGGTGPYTYLWSNGQATQTATFLLAGTYTCAITDANGCNLTTSAVTITEPQAALTASTPTSTNVSCFGGSDGTATVNPTGGTAPYTYLWSNGQATQTAIGLLEGPYACTITDANGCPSVTVFVTITEPQAALTAPTPTTTNVSCFGGNDGTATVIPSGGTAPYTYLWSNTQTTQTATLLSVGTYTCTITDVNGCSFTTSTVAITQPLELVVFVSTDIVSCFGGNDGDATVSASGGTGPYTYLWSDGQTAQTATFLSAGTYTCDVTDANGCPQQAIAHIIQPPSSLVITTDSFAVSCFGGNDGSVSVSASGGWMAYTYMWTDASGSIIATTQTATGLLSGTYSVSVMDANNCIVNNNVFVIQPSVIDPTITFTAPICNGDNNGTATVIANGGTPFTAGTPYTYNWIDQATGLPIGQTSSSAIGLSSGAYVCVISDTLGCTVNDTIIIDEPTAINISLTPTDLSVFGANDGMILSSVMGGVPGYTYTWTSSNGYTNIGLQNLTGLEPGIYTLTIMDASGCQESASTVINQPGCDVIITANYTDPLCFQDLGSIAWTNSNGVGPYFNELTNSNGTILYSVNNLSASVSVPADVYNLVVTDAVGCQEIWNVALFEPDSFIATIAVTDVLCFDDSTGTANVALSGGTSPYNIDYNILNPFLDNNHLIAGTYIVMVEDANGCDVNGDTTNILSYTVNQPDLLVIDSITKTDIACGGISNGSAITYVSGGVFPYAYLWSDGQITQTATNLSAAFYSVIVTDLNGCFDTASITVSSLDSIAPNFSTTSASCNGYSDGSATVNPSGGTPPYTYSWSPSGSTSATSTGLNAAITYLVSITDSNGCSLTFPVNVPEPDSILMNFSTSNYNNYNISCHGDSDAEITAIPSGGTSPYEFSYNNIYYTSSPTFSSATVPVAGISSGWFTVYVKDVNDCVSSDSIYVTEPDMLAPNITMLNPLTCSGGNDGALASIPSGGIAPYTYLWSTLDTVDIILSLDMGIYSVNVTDTNGCTITESYNLAPLFTITVTSSTTNVTCLGSDGTATINAIGGTGPYTYLWSDGQTTATATGLNPGSFVCTVTDLNGCIAYDTINILQSVTSLMIDTVLISNLPNCFGDTDASIIISISGGVAPFSYLWNNGQTTPEITGLSAGTYICTITDSAGCTVSDTIIINEPPAISILLTATDISCFGFSDGVLSSSVTGGTTIGISPYTYSWYGPNSYSSNLDSIFDLESGTYTLMITDANGCTSIDSSVVIEPTPLSCVFSVDNPLCYNDANGLINIEITGGTQPYDAMYSVGVNTYPTNTSIVITGLSAGADTLYVTDVNGCEALTTYINLIEPLELQIDNITEINPTCYNYTDGSAIIDVIGGTLPYNFEDAVGNPIDLTALSAGTPTIVVSDSNGCIVSTQIDIINPDEIEILQLESCYGSILVEVSNFVDSYQIFWDNQPDTVYIDDLFPGVYNVTVIDNLGCTKIESFIVHDPFDYTLADASCLTVADGSIEIYDILGGYPPYSVFLNDELVADDVVNDISFNELLTDNYQILLIDNSSCTILDSLFVIDYVGGYDCVDPPIIISPNSDGTNDTWKPTVDVDVDIHVTIYNRWGQIEFFTQTNSHEFEWDGTANNGNILPTADYYFVIDFIDQDAMSDKTGVITLIR